MANHSESENKEGRLKRALELPLLVLTVCSKLSTQNDLFESKRIWTSSIQSFNKNNKQHHGHPTKSSPKGQAIKMHMQYA
jgi:hypothetical protein